jgi:hypothetical protein
LRERIGSDRYGLRTGGGIARCIARRPGHRGGAHRIRRGRVIAHRRIGIDEIADGRCAEVHGLPTGDGEVGRTGDGRWRRIGGMADAEGTFDRTAVGVVRIVAELGSTILRPVGTATRRTAVEHEFLGAGISRRRAGRYVVLTATFSRYASDRVRVRRPRGAAEGDLTGTGVHGRAVHRLQFVAIVRVGASATVSVRTGGDIAGGTINIQIPANHAARATSREIIRCHLAGAGGRVTGFEIAAASGADLGLIETQAGLGIDAGEDRALVLHPVGVGLELGANGVAVHALACRQVTVAVGVVDVATGIATAGERIADTRAGIVRAATAHGIGANALARAITRGGLRAGVGVGTRSAGRRESTTVRAAAAVARGTRAVADAGANPRIPRAVLPVRTLLAVVALFASIDVTVAALGLIGKVVGAGAILRITHRRGSAGEGLIPSTIASSVAEVKLSTAVAIVAHGGSRLKCTGGGAAVGAAWRTGPAADTSADGGVGRTIGDAIFALFTVVALFANAGISDTVPTTDSLRRRRGNGVGEEKDTQQQ